MQRMRGVALVSGLGVALVAGCAAVGSNVSALMAPLPDKPAASCVVSVFSGAPPFAVDDLGPIQAPCPTSTRHWSSCGIDQPNLADIACSSGADTVFGIYEVVTPQPSPFESGARVVHARLGRRRADAISLRTR
jgi:hypothetical protein